MNFFSSLFNNGNKIVNSYDTFFKKVRGKEQSNGYEKVLFEGEEDWKPEKLRKSWMLFVTGIHPKIKKEDLFEKFLMYGKLKSISMDQDPESRLNRGYVLIEYETYRNALGAYLDMNNEWFDGVQLHIALEECVPL